MGTISPLYQTTAPPAAPAASKKRPFDDELQHVGANGPNGLSQRRLPVQPQAQQQHMAADSPAAGEPRSRPVFKMKRTGHSGPFPFMGRRVLQSESAENAQPGPGAAPPSFSPGPDIQKQKQNSLFEEWGDELPVMTATQMRFTQSF
jgi:hypothetical protein